MLAVGHRRKGTAQVVRPCADDLADLGLDLLAVGVRARSGAQADDDVQAGELTLGKGDRRGGDATAVAIGEKLADAVVDGGGVALARHIDEHGDEAVELVAARQHADTWPLAELQDGEGVGGERLHLELEHLVARIGLQHVGQRLAGMARRGEAAARQHHLRLAAHQRDRHHRARVGVVGEQPDDAHLTGQAAVGREALDADIVHVGTAMDARAQIRLGDDDRVGPKQELADLLRRGDELAAAPEHAHVRVAQNAEPGLVGALQDAVGGVAAVFVFAHAEEGEVVVRQPLDEGLGFRERLRADGEAGRPPLGGDGAGTRPHRLPVGDGVAVVPQGRVEAAGDLHAVVGGGDAVDVDGDEALALARAGVGEALEALEPAVGRALQGEDRVRDEPHHQSGVAEFAHHRIEQKRHVVVEDLDDRHRPSIRLEGRVDEAQPVLAGLTPGERRPGVVDEPDQVVGQVGDEVLGRGVAEHRLGEAGTLGAVRTAGLQPLPHHRQPVGLLALVALEHPHSPVASRRRARNLGGACPLGCGGSMKAGKIRRHGRAVRAARRCPAGASRTAP